MNRHHSFTPMRQSARRPLPAIGVLLVSLALGTQVSAEPSQSPLTSRTAAPPPPNLMLTIDDSGSMLFDFMPEESYKVNGYTVKLASSTDATRFWPVGFPGDPRRSVTKGGYTYSYTIGGPVAAVKSNPSLFQMQFRSPDVNAMYYNPDIRYLPWKDAGALPADMANASYSNAKWDPLLSSTYALNSNKSASTQNWCVGYNNCPSASLTFAPGLVYRLKASTDPNLTSSYVMYDLNDSSNYAAATSHANRTDCDAKGGGTKCTQALEQQNFANWFTYYRLRETMTKAAIGRSLVNYQDKIRVGWSQFNADMNGVITTSRRIQQIVKPMNASYLASVLGNIYKIGSFNGTPTRSVIDEIGEFFKKGAGDSENPWLGSPGDTASGFLACRRSAQFLLTDGYYNDTYTSAGDQDGVNGPDFAGANPDGYSPTRYVAARPFNDAPNTFYDTLSDVSMKYYVNDLQSSIANRVPPVSGDIAFWQHLSQFNVGLGVTGTLDSSTAAAKLQTLAQIKAGTLNWPDPGPAANSAQKIDDMWHAAYNTGGDFYSVKNTTELSKAMNDAIGKAAGGEAREAGVAVSSASVVNGTIKLVPKYKSAVWTGDVEAYVLDAKGNASPAPTWTANSPIGGQEGWASRNLVVWNRDSGVPAAFTWSTMGSTNQAAIGAGGQTLTDWVRGDTTNEGSDKTYRYRSGVRYGDFVNSAPIYVKNLVSLDYAAIDAGYTSFLTAKAARSTSVVFAGANDGMLHAFNGATGDEVMGYLPLGGLVNLKTIAAKDYGTPANYHRFFVDGPTVETDAMLNGVWTNMVIGSMGAGGKGLFALKVPTADPTALTASSVLWDITASSDSDLGYVLGQFAVGKIQGGSASDGWFLFAGNGVDSTSGRAVLLLVNLANGTISKVVLDGSSGNGAMGVSLLKDDHGQVVAAYVGDLKGNLWRVDFGSATDSSSWKVGFSGAPLATGVSPTGQVQPVTTAPTSVAFKKGDGRVVIFGTGKLATDADADSTTVQTVYGVRDPTKAGESAATATSPFAGVANDRTLLQPRYASNVPFQANDGNYYYTITGSPVDWATQYGWYMDLPLSGQRVIYPPQIIVSDYLLVQTMIPAAKAAECEVSKGSGVNYFMLANEGTAIGEPIADTNNDGVVDDKDAIIGGMQTNADGVDGVILKKDGETSPLVCKPGYTATWVGDTGNTGHWICLPNTTLKILDRVWREIVNPPQP